MIYIRNIAQTDRFEIADKVLVVGLEDSTEHVITLKSILQLLPTQSPSPELELEDGSESL